MGTPTGAALDAIKDPAAITRRMNRQIVCDRAGFVAYAGNVANGSNNTQVQDALQITLMADCSDMTFTWGNFNSSIQSAADMSGLSTVTLIASLFDGTNYFPIFGVNGSRNIVIEPGAIVESAPILGDFRKGRGYQLITRKTWASAPANFPGTQVRASSARDLSEAGTALTDRTLSGGFTAGARISSYAIFPPLAIKGTVPRMACVAILGNSIANGGASDADTNRGQIGYAQRGLYLAGIPFVHLGQSGGKISDVVQNPKALGQYLAAAVAAGVTHIYIEEATNDWVTPSTAATIYAGYQTVGNAAARFGIKTVIGTAPPKTNAANNSYNGTETNTFAQRRLLNDMIRANNGVGYGYYDLAALWQNPNNIDLWRTDVQSATGVSLVSGGSGYVGFDIVEMDYGVTLTVSTVSGGVATGVSIRSSQGGGYLTPPVGVLTAKSVQNTASGTWPATPGTGLTVNVTGSQTLAPTSDGLHASPALHSLAATDLSAQAPKLFTLA